jgi:hypothetical protein
MKRALVVLAIGGMLASCAGSPPAYAARKPLVHYRTHVKDVCMADTPQGRVYGYLQYTGYWVKDPNTGSVQAAGWAADVLPREPNCSFTYMMAQTRGDECSVEVHPPVHHASCSFTHRVWRANGQAAIFGGTNNWFGGVYGKWVRAA